MMATVYVENALELGQVLFGLRPPPLRGLAESVFELDEAKSPFPRGAVLTPRRAMKAETANEDGVILPSRMAQKAIEGRVVRLGPGDRFRVVDYQAWRAQLDAELKGEMPGQGGHDAEAFGDLDQGDVLLYLQPEDRDLLANVPPGDDGVPAVFVVAPASALELVSEPGGETQRQRGEDEVEFLARKYGVDLPRAEELARQFYALAAQGSLPDSIETLEDVISQFGEEQGTEEQPKKQRRAGAGRKISVAAPIDPKKLALIPDLTDDDREQLAQALRSAGFTTIDEPKAPVLPTAKFVVGLGPGPMQGYGEWPTPPRVEPELEPPEDVYRGTVDQYGGALGEPGGFNPFGRGATYKYLAAEAAARGLEMPTGKVARQEMGLKGTAPEIVQIKMRDLPYVTVMAYVMPDQVLALAYADKVGAKQQAKLVAIRPPAQPPDAEMSEQDLELYLHNDFRAQFAANPEAADWPSMAFAYLWPRIENYVRSTIRKQISGAATPEEIEDLAQDVARSVIAGQRKYDARRARLKSFLVTVAKSMYMDIGRKKQVRQRYNVGVLRGEIPGEVGQVDIRQAESFRDMVNVLAEQQPSYMFRRYRADVPPKLGKPLAPAASTPVKLAPSSAAPSSAAPSSAPQAGGWGEYLTRPLRRAAAGYAAGVRSAREQGFQAGFKKGFGTVVPPEMERRRDIENQLIQAGNEVSDAKRFYVEMRDYLVDAFAKYVPGYETEGFDITQEIDLSPLVSDEQGEKMKASEKEAFSAGFEKVFMGFLRQSKTFVQLITKLQDVADDLHEVLVGTLGIALQDVRRADGGAAAAMAQWREAFRLAEEVVQRPEPFTDWNAYVEFVDTALSAIQRLFGGIEQALESLDVAIQRGQRTISRLPEDEPVVRKFTRWAGPTARPEDYADRPLPGEEG